MTEKNMQTFLENSNRALEKSIRNLKGLMQQLLDSALKHGATDASVAVNHDKGFSVDVRMQEVETVAFHEDQGVSIVVYFGNKKGSASSTDRSTAALEELVKAACDIAKVSASDPCFALPDASLMKKDHPSLDLYHPWQLEPTQAIDIALQCEKLALDKDKRIQNSDGVNVSTYTFCHGFANTAGGEGILHGTRHSMSCSLIAKSDGNMQRDYDYTTSRKPQHLSSSEILATSTVERTVNRLGARPVKTQRVPILFSSRVSSSLFSSFINAISGNHLYRKNSFLLDALNKQIFPKGFKIYEQPYLLAGLGSSPFDAEGVPTRDNIFVEDGILQQYVLNSYAARRLGLQTTANSGGVHNLTIDSTANGLNDLLQQMKTGLLVTELMGQGVNGLTGDYSRGAAGFWVEQGEIQFPVEEVTIAGNLKEMFLGIVAVGDDINPNISTHCGSVLINEMMVAGT